MSDGMVRQTVRISKNTKDRLKAIIETGQYITESELIRRALNIGISDIEQGKE